MSYTKPHTFDKEVVQRISDYIEKNNLSLPKIASASGMPYQRLYHLLYNSALIKLREYVALCETFHEPLDYFVKDIDWNFDE